MDRDRLVGTARDYLAALDRLDLEAALGFFSSDAVFTIQSSHQEFNGKQEIAGLWGEVLGAHAAMSHTITHVLVDDREGKVATEQLFRGELADGTVEQRH